MLCYQSSRNATDIIHDTFRWLRDNRRVTRVMTLIFVPLSFVAQWYCAAMTDAKTYRDSVDTIASYYIPWVNDSFEDFVRMKVIHTIALMIVALAIVPILRHYFLTRKSVKHITLRRLGELMLEHLKPALAVAALSAGTYLLASMLMATVILGYGALLLTVFPVSASIMHGLSWRYEGFGSNWMLAVRYMLLMSFVVIVLQLLPFYSFGLVAGAIAILEESVEIALPFIANLETEICFLMGALSYLAFAYSMMVLFVSLTLFHGTVAEEVD